MVEENDGVETSGGASSSGHCPDLLLPPRPPPPPPSPHTPPLPSPPPPPSPLPSCSSSLCSPNRRSDLRGGGGQRADSPLPVRHSAGVRGRRPIVGRVHASSLFPPRSLRRSLSKQCHCRRQMFGFLPAESRMDVYGAPRRNPVGAASRRGR